MALGAIAVVLLIVVEQKNSFKKSNSYVSRRIASIRNKALYVHEFGLSSGPISSEGEDFRLRRRSPLTSAA